MKDRGIIKWLPFDSVISSQKVIEQIIKEKSKISKPTLSFDQLKTLEENLLISFHNQSKVKIHYFYKGSIIQIQGTITNILIDKKIIICNQTPIFFEQLLKIEQI